QRSHGQNPAVRNETVNWWHLNRELLDLLVTQYSKRAGSRQDAKWPVFRIARIEVNPQSEHLIHLPSRSMRVNNTFLYRPGSATCIIPALAQRHACILVPYHTP